MIPTPKQLYPKDGLGPTIETPSESFHPFIIDSLDPPPPPPTINTTTQPSTLLQPCPYFPASLAKLHENDLADPLRAAYMSATAHTVLADRLWRTVSLANYFSFDRKPASIAFTPNFPSMTPSQQRSTLLSQQRNSDRRAILAPPPSRAAVEMAVASFLSRVKNSSEKREMENRFTKANRDMGLLLHKAIVEERLVTRRVLFEMFAESYHGRGGGEEWVNCKMDAWGLGAMFGGRGW